MIIECLFECTITTQIIGPKTPLEDKIYDKCPLEGPKQVVVLKHKFHKTERISSLENCIISFTS